MKTLTKILIATPLYPPDIGGPATYSKKLFEELPQHDISVEILSFGEVRHFPKIIRHIMYFFYVLRRGKNADIIYAQDPMSVGLPSAFASFFLRKKFLLKIVGDYAWEQGVQRRGVEDLLDEFLTKKYDFFTESLRRIEIFVARRAKIIVVPSEYLKSVIVRWGINQEKIIVIYNDISLARNLYSKDEVRRVLNFNKEDIILVSAGRLVPWKGFDALVSAMSKVINQYENAKLFIIGDGPQYAYLRDKIYALGLEKNIYLLGSLSHEAVIKYLFSADIFILNTGYEGFSHQLLEAFSVGAPTITTLCCGNREIINPNINALAVAYNNQSELAEAILKLCKDTELRSRLGESAKESVKKYSENSMIEQISALIKKL